MAISYGGFKGAIGYGGFKGAIAPLAAIIENLRKHVTLESKLLFPCKRKFLPQFSVYKTKQPAPCNGLHPPYPYFRYL